MYCDFDCRGRLSTHALLIKTSLLVLGRSRPVECVCVCGCVVAVKKTCHVSMYHLYMMLVLYPCPHRKARGPCCAGWDRLVQRGLVCMCGVCTLYLNMLQQLHCCIDGCAIVLLLSELVCFRSSIVSSMQFFHDQLTWLWHAGSCRNIWMPRRAIACLSDCTLFTLTKTFSVF